MSASVAKARIKIQREIHHLAKEGIRMKVTIARAGFHQHATYVPLRKTPHKMGHCGSIIQVRFWKWEHQQSAIANDLLAALFQNYSRLSCWCGRTATSTGLSIVQGQMLAVPEPTETAWLQGCQILSPCLQWCWISLQPHQGLVKLLVAQRGDLPNHFRQLFFMVSHDS